MGVVLYFIEASSTIFFMRTTVQQMTDVRSLEHKLQQQKAPHQRLILVDQLLSQYAFTNLERAKDLLVEQEKLLQQYYLTDLELNYLQFSAIVENQLYNYEASVNHFKAAIDLVEVGGDVNQQAEVYIDYAGTCINISRMEQAYSLLEKAGKLLRTFPNPRLQARLIAREGYLALHYRNYSHAAELLMEADKQITALGSQISIKDHYFLILIHTGLGNIHEYNDDQVQSVQAYLKVVEMATISGIHSRLAWLYLNVGNGYLALNNLQQAEIYFNKAIENHDDSSPFPKASAYANLGYCAVQTKDYTKALKLFKKAEIQYHELATDRSKNFGLIENWRGLVYAHLNKPKTAEKHFFKAWELAEEVEDFKLLSSICKDLADFYAHQDDHKQAYEYLQQHGKYGDLYLKEVNERKRTELEVKYEAEKQQKEAEVLRLEAARLQLKALRAQMNPHFLYNALNAIQNYITSNEIAYAAKYLAKFAKLMRQSLEYSEIETISLEKEIEFLEDYLYINEKLRFEDHLKYSIKVDEDIEEDILGVPTMIVQPYLENAIEHGLRNKKNGAIQLSFALYDDDTILCVVEDNGIGREQARIFQQRDMRYQNHKSRGTNITEQRLQMLHNAKDNRVFVNTIDLKDEKTGAALGTRVEIMIPIMETQMR
jgi:tetratricopeptide (TPR) repeat protein